jgi:hypothetical protein
MRVLQPSASNRNNPCLTRNWSRGKRFESARRFFILPMDKPNTREGKMIHFLLPRNICRNVWEMVVL